MKITNININSYGNIKDKNIELKDGINIIKGSNESGKSTLLSYISNIFYGISKNKDGKSISDFDRYKPWNGNDFSGKISYKLDNSEKYEVYRDFTKKNPKIYNEKMEDISSNYDIDKKEGNKFFMEQTGLDKQMYLSTVVSMQQEVRLNEKEQNILVQKIANLAGTGEDNVSYKKAITKLQDKIRDEIGTNKTTQKPINITQNKINEIEKELEKIRPYEEKKYSINDEKNQVIEEISQKEELYDIARKLKSVGEAQEFTKHSLEISKKNKSDNLLQLTDLEKANENSEEKCNQIMDKIEKLEGEKISGKYLVFAIIAMVLVALLVVNMLVIKISIISMVAIFGIVLDVLMCFIINGKKKKDFERKIHEDIEKYKQELSLIQNDIAMTNGKIDVLKKGNDSIDAELQSTVEKMESELADKKNEIINEYNGKFDRKILDDILKSNITVQDIDADLANSKVKLKGLEIEEKNILPQLDCMVELEERQEALKQEYAELKEKEEIINISIENLEDAYEEMKTTITPKFTSRLSKTAAKITDGKYNKVTISDTSAMIMENEKGDYIELDRLSNGTIDELYLSLRLSMIDDIAKENMPIILDESFAYFDDERLSNILKYLSEEMKDHQAIIFTCTNRERETLDKLGIKHNLIEM